MIRVPVLLVPGGIGPPVKLAEVLIDNRSALADVSDYRVRIVGKHGRMLLNREGLVEGHRRLDEPVLTLLRKALVAAGY